MRFFKYQALGNDYLVYVGSLDFKFHENQISRICNRHYGVGSDGILLVEKSTSSNFFLKIFNSDGSEAEKSGNGLRIISRYLWDQGLVGTTPFKILTKGGEVTSEIIDEGRLVKVSMGNADFSILAVGFCGETNLDTAIDFPFLINDQKYKINLVSMGNPHCVVFQDNVDAATAKELGPLLEEHPLFSNKTNVQFVQVIDRNNIKIEIWERGAGYTLSSGTSSCAAASVCVFKGLCDSSITVHMPGGKLDIQVNDLFGVTMCGPVSRVGEIILDLELFV
jgi:diaminopimelate epimerase